MVDSRRAPRVCETVVPAGVHGGDYLSVILPGGRPVRILLPADASAGTRLRVLHEHDALPAADSVPGVPAPSHVRLARSVWQLSS